MGAVAPAPAALQVHFERHGDARELRVRTDGVATGTKRASNRPLAAIGSRRHQSQYHETDKGNGNDSPNWDHASKAFEIRIGGDRHVEWTNLAAATSRSLRAMCRHHANDLGVMFVRPNVPEFSRGVQLSFLKPHCFAALSATSARQAGRRATDVRLSDRPRLRNANTQAIALPGSTSTLATTASPATASGYPPRTNHRGRDPEADEEDEAREAIWHGYKRFERPLHTARMASTGAPLTTRRPGSVDAAPAPCSHCNPAIRAGGSAPPVAAASP